VASYIAAAMKAKVALIEENKMGGDCLNTGCVLSKAFIASASQLFYSKRAKEFDFEFADVMDRVHSIIKKVEPHDSVERYTDLGVNCIKERARIISPFEIEVGNRLLTTRNIIVATGSRPMIPSISVLSNIKYYTSDNIWEMRKLPERFVILGAGSIGYELAKGFAIMGTKVTMVQRNDKIMVREDLDAIKIIQNQFRSERIKLLLGHTAKSVKVNGAQKTLICGHKGKKVEVKFDEMLVVLERTPNIEGFGLEELGVELGSRQNIETNDFLQTNYPNIFCSGDVHGKFQFTHTAAHESCYAAVNTLFGNVKKF
jgi:pyruvate/2-oxoglutarate dehydrogenase complex dihydrolipoamide dehydrogenase (E3) component